MNAKGQDLLDIGGAAASADQDEVPVVFCERKGVMKIRLESLRGDQGEMDAGQQRERVGLALHRSEQNGSRFGQRRVRHGHPQVAFHQPPPVAVVGEDLHPETIQQVLDAERGVKRMRAEGRRPDLFLSDQFAEGGGGCSGTPG